MWQVLLTRKRHDSDPTKKKKYMWFPKESDENLRDNTSFFHSFYLYLQQRYSSVFKTTPEVRWYKNKKEASGQSTAY